jgi:hypothetical protein
MAAGAARGGEPGPAPDDDRLVRAGADGAPRRTRSAAPDTASAARSARTAATAIGPRERDTRVGTIELAIGEAAHRLVHFPDWLLERGRRAEQSLISVIATSYLLGVSTRRVEKLVEQLGLTRLSKSQVSDGQAAGRSGRGVPEPAAGHRAVPVRLD